MIRSSSFAPILRLFAAKRQDEKPPDHAEAKEKTGAILLGMPSRLVLLLAALLLLAGLGIRLYDLTDPPLDFHATRQLRDAVLARGIYYRYLPDPDPETYEVATSLANGIADYEPPIVEHIVAFTYLLAGGEHLWIARLYSILFWAIGGVALFALARRMTTPAGALFALGYYLLLPFAVYASRSFQPEPFMVMWLILTLYAAYRWSETRTWKWAILTGVFAAIAALVKIVAAFLLAGLMIAMVLKLLGLRKGLKNPQVWAMALIMVLPSVIYYLIGLGEGSSSYFSNWILALLPMLRDPSFYARWLILLDDHFGVTFVLAGIAGVLLSKPTNRAMLLGLWIGYAVYGLSLPHQTVTHNYYHLQLVPIVALSVAPVFALIIPAIGQQGKVWRVLFAALMLLAVAYPLSVAWLELKNTDYRQEPAYWEQVGEALPVNSPIIALTSYYGHTLRYYGMRHIFLWPITAEQRLAAQRGTPEQAFMDQFESRTADMDYFLVTNFGELDRQPSLATMLYDHYPIFEEGDGYIIFDLEESLD